MVTLLPVVWLWHSFELHLAYLLSIYTLCVWNGGSYYIEVFSKAYRKQFEGDAEARRRLQLELLINGNLPDEEVEPPSPGATPPASPDKAEVLNLEVEGAGAVAGGSGFGAAVQVASARQTRRNKVKSD